MLESKDDPRHGTINGYSRFKCRCEFCRAVWMAYRLSRKPPPPDDPRHGTVNCYSNHNCRCERCRAAWSEKQQGDRARRRALFAAGRLSPEHGRLATYDHYGCRCRLCRDAVSEDRRRRRP